MSLIDYKKVLIDALAEQPANIYNVRNLCIEHPGLIASVGLRLQAWSALLLGENLAEECKKIPNLVDPVEPCAEQHVLEADVHRTRAEVEDFKSSHTRKLIRIILQKFCLEHEIQYKQGMNEVLAPFLVVNPSTQYQGLTYAFFKAFLFRYLERFFCLDESSYLVKAFRLFHLILEYFDPQLANYLHDSDFIPELYAPQWFLTLFARSLPLNQVLRLWDVIIAVDDPAFTFFVGLCIIRTKRTELLLADSSNIPEILSSIQFKSDEDIDSTLIEAIKLYKETPRCILRHLRLCCVSTTELTPNPKLSFSSSIGRSFTSQLHSMRLNVEEHDKRLAIQTARSCVMLSAQELVEYLLPSPSTMNNGTMQQFVIIDIRSYEESMLTGGGTLPRAAQLEPEFLNRPEAFDVWIQHFDGTKGCNICIVDLPPTQWTGAVLWRRLLLGEGDGKYPGFTERLDFSDTKENCRRLDALLNGKRFSVDGRSISQLVSQGPRQEPDLQSKYSKEEEATRVSDLNRPGILLAIALQTHAFPHVSVLEGGFPALVEQLKNMKGTVEPVIINHDSDKWDSFLKSTGRYSDIAQSKTKKLHIRTDIETSNSVPGSTPAGSVTKKESPRVAEIKRLETALSVAERLGHSYMRSQISDTICKLRNNPK